MHEGTRMRVFALLSFVVAALLAMSPARAADGITDDNSGNAS